MLPLHSLCSIYPQEFDSWAVIPSDIEFLDYMRTPHIHDHFRRTSAFNVGGGPNSSFRVIRVGVPTLPHWPRDNREIKEVVRWKERWAPLGLKFGGDSALNADLASSLLLELVTPELNSRIPLGKNYAYSKLRPTWRLDRHRELAVNDGKPASVHVSFSTRCLRELLSLSFILRLFLSLWDQRL